MMPLLYSTYRLTGLNFEVFINSLAKGGVSVYKTVKTAHNTLEITLSVKDCAKFFAILKQKWYNTFTIETVCENRGLLGFCVRLRKKAVFAAFFACFVLLAFVFSGLILDIRYEGATELKEGINQTLFDMGVKTFSFSQGDYSDAERAIRSLDNRIIYCGITRRGNVLIVYTELARKTPTLREKTDLLSDVSGTVVEVKVAKGTALVAVGDEVKKGETLIGAYISDGEVRIPTYALGCIKILVRREYTVSASLVKDEKYAEILGAAILGFEPYRATAVRSGDIIKVTLEYVTTVSAEDDDY